ncbi:hypothetical protein HDU83_005817 [Entophlyctis luteolus]|nr:hypothetical protein HDU83_005817 [Entophlyctis luteolus]
MPDSLVTTIVAMRAADPALTIRKAHAVLAERTPDLALSAVKKAFQKATARIRAPSPSTPCSSASSSSSSSSSAPRLLPVPDPNDLWLVLPIMPPPSLSRLLADLTHPSVPRRTALRLLPSDPDAALHAAADAFLAYPDTPSNELHRNTPRANASLAALLAAMNEACAEYDATKRATSLRTPNALVLAAGVCMQRRDTKTALAMAVAARDSYSVLLESRPRSDDRDDSAESARLGELWYFSACLLGELSFFKDSHEAFCKAVELRPECTRSRQMRCVAAFKATRFNAVVDDALWLKAQAETVGLSKYLVAPYLCAAVVSFMGTKIDKGNEWMALARDLESTFKYKGPDVRLWEVAVQSQESFNKKEPKK